jgi:hypothetical protein
VLAGACLATAFTWMLHHGPVRTLAALGDGRLGDATAGRLLCGVAASSRVNGALALGVAGRCVRLMGETGRADAAAERLGSELGRARAALDAALDAAAGAAPPAADAVPARERGARRREERPADAAPAPDPAAQMATARAAASALAHRAAGALVVAAGSRAILDGRPAGRLLREAAFTLVAAGRDAIRTDLLGRMTTSRTAVGGR